MRPHISVLTLAVQDLERAVSFYRDGLGLPTEGIIGQQFEHGAVAFFQLQPRLKLAVWAQRDLVHDTGLPQTPLCPTGFTIGHNVGGKDEVDEVMAQAGAAGATVIKHAQDTFWGGYAGYFQDPDGHVWEIVWNPSLMPEN